MRRKLKIAFATGLATLLLAYVGIVIWYSNHVPAGISPSIRQPEPPPPYSTLDEPLTLSAAPDFPTVDQLLDKLDLGQAAFGAPNAMNLRDVGAVTLNVVHSASSSELLEEIRRTGLNLSQPIKIGKRMQAKLTGHNFNIKSLNELVQAVSRREPTVWKWEIHPTSEGTHDLHLSLSVLLNVDNRDTPRTIETFSKSVEVKVTHQQRLSRFWDNNWPWLGATVLIPFLTWMLRRRKSPSRGRPE